jgi:hypothetical protein
VIQGGASPGSHPRHLFPDGGDDGAAILGDRSAIVHHRAMVALSLSLFGALRSGLRTRADLVLENLALRQQLVNLRRTSSRARLISISQLAIGANPLSGVRRQAESAGQDHS